MDFTKALDELRRVKDFLSAITVTEATMLQAASLGDQVAALNKKKDELLSLIATLSGDYSKAKAAHDAAIGRLTSERTAAQDDLLETRKEIAAARKAFAAEKNDHAATVFAAKKEHSATLSEMHREIEATQARMDSLKERLQKINTLAG